MDKKEFKKLRERKLKKYPEMFSMFTKRNVNFHICAGGVPCTSEDTIVIAIPEFCFEDVKEWRDQYLDWSKKLNREFNLTQVSLIADALFWHERGHQQYSSFESFQRISDWAVKNFSYLKTKAKLSKEGLEIFDDTISYVIHFFNNALEDGRIENLSRQEIHSIARLQFYLNDMFWIKQEEPLKSDLLNFISAALNIATMDVYPQYFPKLDTELKDSIKKIKKDIEEFVNISDTKEAELKFEMIIKKVQPYLEKLLVKELNDAAKRSVLQKAISKAIEQEFKNAKPMGKPPKGKGTPKGMKVSSSSDKGTGTETGTDSSAKKGKDKGKDNSDGSSDGKSNKDGDKGKDGEKKEGPEDYQEATNKAPDDAEGNGEEGGSANNGNQAINNNGTGTNSKGNVSPDDSDETIVESIKGLKETIDKDMESLEGEETRQIIQEDRKEKEADKKSESLNEKILEEIKGSYKNDYQTDYGEIPAKENKVKVNLKTPDEIRSEGKKLRNQLEKYFKEQESFDMTNQRHGKITTTKLFKVATNDNRIFEKKGTPYNADTAIAIAWDGSGSMSGDKQVKSTIACATIEEALKPIVPLRIINFTVDGRMVKHFIVKKFEDRRKDINYSYSYGSSRGFNGGNKDGYSIKVLTQELLKRPEKTKVLFVLSDGEPSDYPSYKEAYDDVRNAVNFARRNSIIVISIFFGTEDFRKNSLPNYEYMYGKDLISCDPKDIYKALVKSIRRLLIKR